MDDVKATNETLVKELRERFQEAQDAAAPMYQEMIADLEFTEGAQWPDAVKADREADGRPCLVIDKLSVFADQVKGDIRQNEPTIKVKPVDSGGDPDVAAIFQGLIRDIQVRSNAEIAYDTAAESAVDCGFGAFRIVTEYCDDTGFDQHIRIRRIKNPFTVFFDPVAQEWDKSDARYVFVTERIPREDFKRLYPDAAIVDFSSSRDKDPQWADDKTIRVAEYFVKKAETRKLYLLESPFTQEQKTSDTKEEGWTVLKERPVKETKVVSYKTNGRDILEGPDEWPSKYFPICGVWGKELNIEGRTVYRGIIRKAKDPQRLYNYSRSHSAEITALAPKVPYLVTAKMIGNYQRIWDTAHRKSYPYLPIDVDPALPSFPKRAEPITQSTAIMAEIQIADQEMHDTTGLQQSNMGQKSNEQSGRAILARQREGDIANFAFYDNLGRAVQYAGRVLVDMIPRVYDTARVVRIIGEESQERFVPINQPVQVEQPGGSAIEKVFDLSVGEYDVVVSIGPAFSTQRDEALQGLMDFINAVPPAGPLIGDIMARNMDWPGAQEVEQRLKMLLPPQLGGPPPPPDPNAPQPEPPDPFLELEGQKRQAEIEGMLLDNRGKRWELARKETGVEDEREDAAAERQVASKKKAGK